VLMLLPLACAQAQVRIGVGIGPVGVVLAPDMLRRFAPMAITPIIRTPARLTATMGRSGSPVGSSSAPARGITAGDALTGTTVFTAPVSTGTAGRLAADITAAESWGEAEKGAGAVQRSPTRRRIRGSGGFHGGGGHGR